jgi:transcriptional regulator with XRE-family HTH domain
MFSKLFRHRQIIFKIAYDIFNSMSRVFKNILKDTFSKRLRQLRKSKGLTQAQLGEKIGLGVSVMGHFETGRQSPSFESFCLLVEALDTSADYLLGRNKEQNSETVCLPGFDSLDEQTQEAIRDFVSALAKNSKN